MEAILKPLVCFKCYKMDVQFLYLRNELKFRRSLLNAKTKIGEATATEKHKNVVVTISKKLRWKFCQGDKFVLDEFENQRVIDPRFVTLFTEYLTIFDSTAIHSDRDFFGTMPLPESEEVFKTNKWELKRAVLVQEETSRRLSNNILIPETFKNWKSRISCVDSSWKHYNMQLNSLWMNLMTTLKNPILAKTF